MPITIAGVSDAGPGRPVPVVSPMIEFGSALHVLGDPEHHGAAGWAAQMRGSMTAELAAQTGTWTWTAQAIRAAPLVTAAADDFEARVADLRAMPPGQLAAQLLRPIARADSSALPSYGTRSGEPRRQMLLRLPATLESWTSSRRRASRCAPATSISRRA